MYLGRYYSYSPGYVIVMFEDIDIEHDNRNSTAYGYKLYLLNQSFCVF